MGNGSLPPSILDSIALSNVSSVGMAPSVLANQALGNVIANVNLAQQNAVSSQQSMNQLQLATLGKMVDRLTRLSAAEIRAAQNMRSAGSLELLLVLALLKTQLKAR